MKTSLFKLAGLMVIVMAFGAASALRANPIQVAYGPVNTQPSSNGLPQVTTWATGSIATFNTNAYAGAPLPDLGGFQFESKNDGLGPVGWAFGTGVNSITLDLTGYKYIVLSWGGSQIPDDQGTADYLYYINGTGSWTFYNNKGTGDGTAANAKGGLSGVRVFGTTAVPDGGLTALLLGLGFLSVAAIARRRQKKV